MEKKICSVIDCSQEAVRSLSQENVEKAGFKVAESRRAFLCGKHYKEFKKKTKKERRIQRWRWQV